MNATQVSNEIARVLIVGEEDGPRRNCTDYLARVGFAVAEADNGEHAWELLQGQPVDLLIVDHAMPGGAAVALMRRMRRAGRQLPVVAIAETSQIANELEAAWPRLGAVVSWPFSYYELLLRIDSALHGGSRDPFEPNPPVRHHAGD